MSRLFTSLLPAFAHSRRGNLAVTFTLALLPLMLGVGMATDYGRASTERSDMQNALDAAVMAALLAPGDLTRQERQAKLNQFFAADGGNGTATIVDLTDTGNGLAMKARASWDMPTTFLAIANVTSVQVGVEAAANTPRKVVDATFRFDDVWGDWSKDIILKGVAAGSSTAIDLMRMQYRTKITYRNFVPSGTANVTMQVRQADGSYRTTYTRNCVIRVSCTETGNRSAAIDVGSMSDIYLQFSVLAGPGGTYNSNNASQAGRMYLANYPKGTVPALQPQQVRQTAAVNIFNLVPCGLESKQSWEDGGSTTNHPSSADFHYFVTGRCETDTAKGGVRMTQ